MALEGEQGIVPVHTVPIIGDANELAAPSLDHDGDAIGSGVERVFKQLLHDGSRPIHHLARSDLIGDLVGKDADAAHKPLA